MPTKRINPPLSMRFSPGSSQSWSDYMSAWIRQMLPAAVVMAALEQPELPSDAQSITVNSQSFGQHVRRGFRPVKLVG